MSIQDALANAYVASLPSAAQKLGILHAVYGLGALVTPLVATSLVDKGVRWSYAYAVVLGIAALNASIALYAFRMQRWPEEVQPAPESQEDGVIMEPPVTEDALTRLKRVLRSKTAILFSVWLFVYVGVEVSLGGWLTTYLIDEKAAGTRGGYVSSAFFGGLTLGRIVMPQINIRIGEWRAIAISILLAAIFQAIIWVVPGFVAASVLYAITGFCIGSHYPTAISLATKLLPRSLHTGAIGFCASLGQTGSAIFPFIIGALAQRFTVIVLQPALIVMLGSMGLIWAFVPRPKRPED